MPEIEGKMPFFLLATSIFLYARWGHAQNSESLKGCSMSSLNKCYGSIPPDGSRSNNLLEEIGLVPDTQTCQSFCRNLYNGTCTWFMFDRTTSDCKLFSGSLDDLYADCKGVGYSREPDYNKCNVIFTPDSENRCYNFREDYCRFEFNLLENLENIGSLSDCQLGCKYISNCTYFVYDNPTNTCKLNTLASNRPVCDIIHGTPEPEFDSCINDLDWASRTNSNQPSQSSTDAGTPAPTTTTTITPTTTTTTTTPTTTRTTPTTSTTTTTSTPTPTTTTTTPIPTTTPDIIIQRHVKGYGSNFAKYWDDYKAGFGSPEGNYFWIGLDRMHELTSSGDYYLEVQLRRGGQTKTVKWMIFWVDPESNKYRLTVNEFDRGTSGLSDLLSGQHGHKGMAFSTRDRDNDQDPRNACSTFYGNSGWWYSNCFACHLNHGKSSGPRYGDYYDESTMILKRK